MHLSIPLLLCTLFVSLTLSAEPDRFSHVVSSGINGGLLPHPKILEKQLQQAPPEQLWYKVPEDRVSEYSVQPSSSVADHFLPNETTISTNAAFHLLEDVVKCASHVTHEKFRISRIGNTDGPKTLVMSISKRTNTLVFHMMSDWCTSNKTEIQDILKRSSFYFLPELPTNSQICSDYNNIDYHQAIIKQIMDVVPGIDMVLLFATGGIKVRYINGKNQMGERAARLYMQKHEGMVGEKDKELCYGSHMVMIPEVFKQFVWAKTPAMSADALLVQTSCCYEETQSGKLYGENKRSIESVMKMRTQGFYVRTETSGIQIRPRLKPEVEWTVMELGQVTFFPLADGTHSIETKNGDEEEEEFTIEISTTSPYAEKTLHRESPTGQFNANAFWAFVTALFMLFAIFCCAIRFYCSTTRTTKRYLKRRIYRLEDDSSDEN